MGRGAGSIGAPVDRASLDLIEPVGRSIALGREPGLHPFRLVLNDLAQPMSGLSGLYLRPSQLTALERGHTQYVPVPAGGEVVFSPDGDRLVLSWRAARSEPFASQPHLGTASLSRLQHLAAELR